MKTEKELKDALEDIFFDALTDKSNPPYYTDKVDPENDGYWQCKVYELCADELIKRGYGDLSEYKAEIERLKDDNAKLQEQFVQYQMASDKEIKAQVKQSKIDVLNKVKHLAYYDDNYLDGFVFIDDIDKFLDEVQNETK